MRTFTQHDEAELLVTLDRAASRIVLMVNEATVIYPNDPAAVVRLVAGLVNLAVPPEHWPVLLARMAMLLTEQARMTDSTV